MISGFGRGSGSVKRIEKEKKMGGETGQTERTTRTNEIKVTHKTGNKCPEIARKMNKVIIQAISVKKKLKKKKGQNKREQVSHRVQVQNKREQVSHKLQPPDFC